MPTDLIYVERGELSLCHHLSAALYQSRQCSFPQISTGSLRVHQTDAQPNRTTRMTDNKPVGIATQLFLVAKVKLTSN